MWNEDENRVSIYLTISMHPKKSSILSFSSLLVYGEHEKLISGSMFDGTYRIAQLVGTIAALKTLRKPCDVILYSSSLDYINFLKSHKRFKDLKKNKSKTYIANAELWENLLPYVSKHTLTYEWLPKTTINQHFRKSYSAAIEEFTKSFPAEYKHYI